MSAGSGVVAGMVKGAVEAGSGPTWARLFKQRHAAYDADLWCNLDLLHKGGFEIQKLQNARRFIDKAPEEPQKYYDWRLKTTAYVNYMAKIVGFLVGNLFGVSLKVSPEGKGGQPAPASPDDAFYGLLSTDCDMQGTDFSQFMRERLTCAMVQKRALIGVDLPVGQPAVNRLEEDERGLRRAWLFPIPLESVLNWKLDEKGRFKWCKVVKKVTDDDDPLGDHSRFYYEFKIWRVEPGSFATFEVYRTPWVEKEEELKDDELVPLFQPPTTTSFTQIPILNMEMPEALWAGNQIGPLCREHYNGRSDLRGSLCRNLVEIPYVKLGSEIPEVHGAISITGSDPNRGDNMLGKVKQSGFMKIGGEDEIGFAGPSGRAFEMGATENARVRDEIFGALNTMALALSNTPGAVRRSGESKAEDRSATGVILGALGILVRENAKAVYDLVSDGRGEDAKWLASGIDSYDDEDRAALIGEATEVEMLPIPSKTFKKLYATNLVNRLLPKASDAQKEQMAGEIDSGMTDDLVLPPKPPLPVAGKATTSLPAKPAVPKAPPIPGDKKK